MFLGLQLVLARQRICLLCYALHAFFIRNHFIRNLHVDVQDILGTYTTKGNKVKDFSNFKTLLQLGK